MCLNVQVIGARRTTTHSRCPFLLKDPKRETVSEAAKIVAQLLLQEMCTDKYVSSSPELSVDLSRAMDICFGTCRSPGWLFLSTPRKLQGMCFELDGSRNLFLVSRASKAGVSNAISSIKKKVATSIHRTRTRRDVIVEPRPAVYRDFALWTTGK